MDSGELELFERSVRRAIEQHSGAALDDALRELGWLEARAANEAVAVRVLFTLLGRANATSSALTWVLGCDVLPQLGGCAPPARRATDRLRIDGVGFGTRNQMVVVTDDEAFDVPLDGLTVTPVQGLDASLNLVKLAGDIPQSIGRPMHWNGRVAVGQLAIGHQLVGAARAMLELATDHARERVQFGRPISSFQAVRHRLADTLVAVEAADALLDAAWEDTTMAAMGKAFAGQAARTAARHCQQVLAGIGFTAEHPFHRYLRRTLVLDQLLGSGRRLTRQLGESVRETRRLPPMLKLRA